MDLEIGTFPVESVAFGPATGWVAGRLTIDHGAGRAPGPVRHSPSLGGRGRGPARRGHPPVQMRDVMEPRVKVAGAGHVYPGIAGHPPDTVGDGVTHRYAGSR